MADIDKLLYNILQKYTYNAKMCIKNFGKLA